MLLDPVQSMTHSVGVAKEHLGGATHRRVAVEPHLKRFESVSRSSSGRSSKSFKAPPIDFTITSGEASAAVARIEPSNTATGEEWRGRPRYITLAICSACGVSRRSSKHELTPTRFVVSRHTKPRIASSCRSEVTCTILTCKSG